MKHHPTAAAACSVVTAALLTTLSAFGGPAASAPTGKGPVAEPEKEKDWCDEIWSIATLYKNENNPFIQEFAITGRYQGQFAAVDSDYGDEEGWDHRRFRLGFRAKVFKDFEVKNEMYSEFNHDDFYAGLTESYIAWKPSDAFNLTVGKQKPRFSLDWSTSSREILTIERNILINNFGIDYETGLSVSGKNGNWTYFGGAFNNDTGDIGDEREYGDLDGGWSWIASVGYDLKDQVHLDKAVLRADFIHMDHDIEDDLLTRFDDALALSFNAKQGKLGVITEFLWAEGDQATARRTDGEMWGFYIMPIYDISKKLQLVARYTHGESDDNALRLQNRYERGGEIGGITIPGGGYGDSYNAYYLGLNYYICSHRLKLMTGIEYSEMESQNAGGDVDTWSWVSGIRMYW